MTRAEKGAPQRQLLSERKAASAAKGARVGVAFRSKDDAVMAARTLGDEVVQVQIKRHTGRIRKIAQFEIPANDAADLIARTKLLSASVKVTLQPTPKLTAAANGPFVGPFKTKKELFDALEAKTEG